MSNYITSDIAIFIVVTFLIFTKLNIILFLLIASFFTTTKEVTFGFT